MVTLANQDVWNEGDRKFCQIQPCRYLVGAKQDVWNEGDRKGPHPSRPHHRSYNDYDEGHHNRSHCRGGGGWEDGWGPLRSPWGREGEHGRR